MCLGLIGRIVRIEGEGPGLCAFIDGWPRAISLLTLPDARVGDTISVHAGFGVAVVEPAPGA